MKNNETIFQIISFVLLLVLQLFFFGKMDLYDLGFCFAFVSFVISAPASNGLVGNMLLAFALGILIDTFDHTLGINAFCAVLLAFSRDRIYKSLASQVSGDIKDIQFTYHGLGKFNFFILTTISMLVYTSFYFFLHAPGFDFFWKNFLKIIFSTIYSTFIIISIQVLFYPKSKSV